MLNSIKNLSKLVILNSLVAIYAYFLTIKLANEFGPKDFGLYSSILIYGLFFSQFIIFSTDSTARYISNIDGLISATNKIIKLKITGLVFTSLLLLMFGFKFGFIWSFCVFVVALSGLNLSFFYELNSNNVKYSTIYLIEKFIYISLIFVIDIIDIIDIFIIMFLTSLLSLSFQYFSNKIKIYEIVNISLRDIYNIYKINFYLYISALLTFVYGGVGRLLIGKFYGFESLGKFSAAWQLIFIVTLFQGQVVKVWRKKLVDAISNKNKSKFITATREYFILTTIPVCIISILIFLFSEKYFSIFFTDKYLDAIIYLKIVSFYFLVINIEYFSGMIWSAVKNKKIYFIIYLFYSLMTLILMFFAAYNLNIFYFIGIIPIMHGLCVMTSIFFFFYKYMVKI